MNAHLFPPEHQPINEDGHYMMTDAVGRFMALNENLPWYTCMCGQQFWAKVGDLAILPVCGNCGYDPHKNSRMPLHLTNTTSKLNADMSEQTAGSIENLRGTGRRSGRSTRLIDIFIQKLFNTGAVEIFDHHRSIDATKDLFGRFCDRLNHEHGGGFIVDRQKFTVKTPKP